METKKLYYEDCLLRQFSAVVLSCREEKGGFAVCLDATAFYPEGGGQAADAGTLDGVAVLDVREADGRVIHLCAAPLPVGKTVEGVLDWQRRFDLMQQHTGEHLVSGEIHRRFGYHNVGFHMGSEYITIDFDGPVPPEALPEIEQAVNGLIWQDKPVLCGYPSEEELPTIPYRSKRPIPWPVRIVQIPEGDICACCGVHVPTTGQVGFVKLFSCVKFHQGVRIEMACGGRALQLLNAAWEQNKQVSQAFSAKVLETGEAARRMNAMLAEEKFRAAGLQKKIFAGAAEACRGAGDVLCVCSDLTPAQVRELAETVGAVCGGTAAVLSGGAGRFDVCLAQPGGDVKALGQRMNQALCGRGGGRNGFFQGSVQTDLEKAREFFAAFRLYEF